MSARLGKANAIDPAGGALLSNELLRRHERMATGKYGGAQDGSRQQAK